MKIVLERTEPLPNSTTEELAKVLLARFGLTPRKKDGNAKLHTLLLELSERKKIANRDRTPESAVITVEEMGLYSGIKRQTMYEYLNRFLELSILKKTSFVTKGKVVIGYELNGVNLESAFRKAEQNIKNHLDTSFTIIDQLQREVKKEKISASSKREEYSPQQDSLSPASDGNPDQAIQ